MGPAPIQMAGGKFAQSAGTVRPQSEDCLYLNVWSFDGARNAPVFIYIFGGGHHAGDAATPDFDLSAFARHGIVAVSFNYRLGALGFYDFTTWGSEFESNCGFSDCIAAVKWVHENIAAFGGDPDRVTVCGESAGGTTVMALLAAPSVKGCFKRAIVMSGLGSNITNDKTQAIHREQFRERLGIKDGHELFTMPAEEIKKGCAPMFTVPDTEHPGILPPGPIIDDLIPRHPVEAARRGEFANVYCIFGTCRDEGALFWLMRLCPMSREEVEIMFRVNGYGHLIPALRHVYGSMGEKQAVRAVNRDRMFWADTMKLAIEQSRHSESVYMYSFEYETPLSRILGLGATHSMDVCPALGSFGGSYSTLYGDGRSRSYRNLTRQLHGAFVDFIRTGRPGVDGEHWDPFRDYVQAVMHFSRKTHQTIERPSPEVYDLWKDIRLYM